MSFKIKETVKWQEEMHVGKFDLFDRIFTINESPGKNHELKFSVNLKRTKENNPEFQMALIEGTNILNDPVCLVLEYESLDGSGQWKMTNNNLIYPTLITMLFQFRMFYL